MSGFEGGPRQLAREPCDQRGRDFAIWTAKSEPDVVVVYILRQFFLRTQSGHHLVRAFFHATSNINR